jgi:hypothetical protein
MEEKKCCERLSHPALTVPPCFFLQHCSKDSLQGLFLPVEAAELKTRKALVSTTARIASRMVFLLLIVDFFHLTPLAEQMLQ